LLTIKSYPDPIAGLADTPEFVHLTAGDKQMNFYRNYIWTFLPALVLAAGTVLAGPPQPVSECGIYITEPGKYKVVNDLACGPSEGGIRILASNVMLDLGGHTLSCDLSGIPYVGVVVGDDLDPEVFSNVRISNGTVTGCGVGVLLWFTDGARVTKMSLIDNVESAVTVVETVNNVIKNNEIEGGEWAINSYRSNGNSFDHNTIRYSLYGIDLYGETDSRVSCNTIDQGFYTLSLGSSGPTPSSGNLIRGNLVTDSFMGILIYASGTPEDGLFDPLSTDNLVHANIAQGNWFADLTEAIYNPFIDDFYVEPGAGCQNTWKNNQFNTQFGPPGCIGEPVDLDDICAPDEDDD
jgi:hypothetical protein